MATATHIQHKLAPITKKITLTDIFSELFGNVSEREQQVLSLRFGLAGNEPHTLEAIGQKFGITRERVRQIENASIKKLTKVVNTTALPAVLTYAKAYLEANGGIVERYTLLRDLLAAVKSDSEADLYYLELAMRLDEGVSAVHNTIRFQPFYCVSSMPTSLVGEFTTVMLKALKSKKDVISFADAAKAIKTATGSTYPTNTLGNAFKIAKELKVTEGESVGLFKWAHINPRNIHDKVIFVLKEEKEPMHFGDITEKIASHKFDTKKVNVQAVHNELIRNDNFILIGRGIYALKEWGYKPGTVADVITEILKKHGPLERDAIIEKVLEVRQVKKITIQLNLKNKKLFERVGRNTYDVKG